MSASTRSETGPPAHLMELVERVEEAAADRRYAPLKEMWTRHHRLEKVEKPPVYVGLYIRPDYYPVVWQELIPPHTLRSEEPLERSIEIQLSQRLYKHDHIPDDDVLLPTVWVKPARPRLDTRANGAKQGKTLPGDLFDDYGEHSEGRMAARLWGLPFLRRQTGDPGGSYKVEPVVTTEHDVDRLHSPNYEVDDAATRRLLERAAELVGGRLPVKLATDEIGFCPSETVVNLMGIEAILYGVIDSPDFIHRMMGMVTDWSIAYHKAREAAGAVDAEESWYYRAHYEELPPGADLHSLANIWSTISAQSLCGLSPAMYEEFLQPYHARLAESLGGHRVYYHACENITQKLPIIRRLPNLRRIHISPWTDLEAAVTQLDREFVLETEAHPTDTLYVHTPSQMREAVERILEVAGHSVLDINLTAIETVNGNPSVLTTWAQMAQEAAARYA